MPLCKQQLQESNLSIYNLNEDRNDAVHWLEQTAE